MREYWLYIDSYVALFKDANNVVLYNMLQKRGFRTKNSQVLDKWVEELLKEDNLYCITVEEDMLADPACKDFIRILQESCSGGLIEKRLARVKPVNFPPVLNLQKERGEAGTQEYVLAYLYEVNIYLSVGEFIYNEPVKADFSSYRGKQLDLAHVEKLLRQLKAANVRHINIFGELPPREQVGQLMEKLSLISCRKAYFLDLPRLEETGEWINRLKDIEIDVKVMVNMNRKTGIPEVLGALQKLKRPFTEVVFYATSREDVGKVEEITEKLKISSYTIRPLYTGDNLDFFKEAVYLNEEDILSSECERRVILAHTVLNTYNFGKISLLPGGDVYAGLNAPLIGNVEVVPLNNLICKELNEGETWLKIRNQGPCSTCVYHCLCPSPSGYEKVIGKENLCHVLS